MKRSFGKIALMLAAATVALAALSVGYGLWSKTLTISGTVNTGNINLVIENPDPNDFCPPPVVPPDPPIPGEPDPLRDCTWDGTQWDCSGTDKYCHLGVLPPVPPGHIGWLCSGNPIDGTDMACTETELTPDGKSLSINLHSPYVLPVGGYCPTVDFDLVNRGSVPVILVDVTVDTSLAREPAGSGVLALVPTLSGVTTGMTLMPGVPAPSSIELCMTPDSKPGVTYSVTVTATGHNYNEP